MGQDAALADAAPAVLWLDRGDRPEPGPPLCGGRTADLVVVGAGYTGLWAALLAKRDDPSLDVVVVDGDRVGGQASGRNGGFCSSSLTHGLANGERRFGGEMARIERFARDNFDAIALTVRDLGIDCDWRANGSLAVATEPWQVEGLAEDAALAVRYGHDATVLDRDEVRAELDSPTFHGGLWQRTGEATVDPARLAWGLAAAAPAAGVDVYERTPMVGLSRAGPGMAVRTASGTILCRRVVLATNAFPSPLRAVNRRIAPVYDHVLATEPLSDAQLDAIGWRSRQGVSDVTNRFHYYRLTDDRRIVWGGYDALYYYGSRIDPSLEQRDATHRLLAAHFFATFPKLEGLRFTHRWGGVIDTCTRFSVTFETAFDGRVAAAVGYTGLGVGASRFGARVCLDLLYHPGAETLSLDLVRRRAVPFPPEPVRFAGIAATRRALATADRRQGRRGPWLRLLDSLGLGFDS